MGRRFADFEVSFRTGLVVGRGHVGAMPFAGGSCQLRAVAADGPGGALIEADGQIDVQVGVVGAVQAGNVVVCYCVGDFSLCHLGDEVFGTHAVAPDEVDADASAQFLVQVDQPFMVFARLHVDVFADELGDVLQWLFPSAAPLHDDLMGDDFFAAVEQAFFPFFGDGQGVGY